MVREGEPSQEGESNDRRDHFQPLTNPLNSIYFDDQAFGDAVDFGVLYSCVVPGSGNLLGGRAMVIRNFASSRAEALVKDYGYKMALGYNPRSTTDWRGERPNSRMALYAMLEKKFDDLLHKREKTELARTRKLRELAQREREKQLTVQEVNAEQALINREYELELSLEDRALLELLNGQKSAKIHVHKHDDVLYLIEFVKKYKLRATADHTEDVYIREIFDALGDNNIPVVYGPMQYFAYKVELKHASYRNARTLMKSRAFFGLMSDQPAISPVNLRDQLKFFLIQGMPEEEAISIITRRNAIILGLDDTLGSVSAGKLASLVVWNKDPLTLGAFPKMVMAEGKVVRGSP
jgi:imidazolonepropionase-like amidohydrolase